MEWRGEVEARLSPVFEVHRRANSGAPVGLELLGDRTVPIQLSEQHPVEAHAEPTDDAPHTLLGAYVRSDVEGAEHVAPFGSAAAKVQPAQKTAGVNASAACMHARKGAGRAAHCKERPPPGTVLSGMKTVVVVVGGGGDGGGGGAVA
jgi:hypothetical protein